MSVDSDMNSGRFNPLWVASPRLSLSKDFGPDTISRIAKLHANELAEQSPENIKHDDKKLTSQQTINGVVHAHQRD